MHSKARSVFAPIFFVGGSLLIEAFGTLLFLLTILGTLAAIILMVVALAKRNSRLASRLILVGFAWLGVYVLLTVLVSWLTPQAVLSRTQERCFDEMCFSVTQVSMAHTVGAGSQQQTAQGVFELVTVQLRNSSQRTPQKPDSPAFLLADQHGAHYDLSNAAQQVLGQQPAWNQKLQPGERQTRELAFAVPTNAGPLFLVVAEGGWPSYFIIGDENSFLHSKTEISLAP
jgi:Domain of unknown function (DUF4352)